MTKKDYKKDIIENLTVLADDCGISNDTFKERAYRTVIKNVKAHKEPIYEMKDLKDVKGIGAKIRAKLEQLFSDGRIDQVEAIKRGEVLTSSSTLKSNEKQITLIELQSVYGIGNKKAKELYETHGVRSIADLKKKSNLLNDKQKLGLKYIDDILQRIPRDELRKHEKKIFEIIKKVDKDKVLVYHIMGSYRRKADNSGDIDLLITDPSNSGERFYSKILQEMSADGYIIETLAKGHKKFMGISKLEGYETARRLDVLNVPFIEYPFALMYFTGNAEFNVEMRNHANELGYTLNEKQLSYINGDKKGERVEGTEGIKTEEDLFNFLSLEYVRPENRKAGAVKVKE